MSMRNQHNYIVYNSLILKEDRNLTMNDFSVFNEETQAHLKGQDSAHKQDNDDQFESFGLASGEVIDGELDNFVGKWEIQSPSKKQLLTQIQTNEHSQKQMQIEEFAQFDKNSKQHHLNFSPNSSSPSNIDQYYQKQRKSKSLNKQIDQIKHFNQQLESSPTYESEFNAKNRQKMRLCRQNRNLLNQGQSAFKTIDRSQCLINGFVRVLFGLGFLWLSHQIVMMGYLWICLEVMKNIVNGLHFVKMSFDRVKFIETQKNLIVASNVTLIWIYSGQIMHSQSDSKILLTICLLILLLMDAYLFKQLQNLKRVQINLDQASLSEEDDDEFQGQQEINSNSGL